MGAVDLATIGLAVDSRPVRQATSDLDRFARSARPAEQGAQRLERAGDGMARRFEFMARTMSRVVPLLAGGAGGIGLVMAAQNAVRAFEAFDRQQRITDQILRATGGAAGRTAQQIDALSESIAAATLASASDVRDAANQLLTFTNITGDAFDRTLRAAQDLASLGFGSITSATQQMAKALEDPINGLAGLRRAGVSFSESQRETIRQMVESGRVAEAQRLILSQVEAQVGGAGAAAGGGLAGAYDSLTGQIDIFIRRTGEQIATLSQLETIMNRISSGIGEVNARAGGGIPAVRLELRDLLERQAGLRSQIADLERTPMARVMVEGTLRDLRQELREVELGLVSAEEGIRRFQAAQGRANAAAAMNARLAEEERRADLLASVNRGLDEEIRLARMSNVERRIAQEIGRAGVEQGTAEAATIEARVRALFAEAEARNAASGAARGGAAARLEEASAAARVIEALREEIDLLGATATQREIAQRLSEAQVGHYTREGQAIAELVARLHEKRGAMEQMEAIQQQVASSMSDLFMGIVTGSQSAQQAIGQLLQQLGRLLVNRAFQSLAASLFPMPGGGGGFILPPPRPFAMGGVFDAGRVIPFANGGVVSGATMFPMAGGRTGVMGEAGEEAIMPLARGPDGKLGVRARGGGAQALNVNVSINLAGANGDAEVRRLAREAANEGVGQALKAYDKALPGRLQTIQKRQG